MATKKFAGPSPYTFPDTYPKDDYLHTEYLNNVNTNMASKSTAAPLVGAVFGLGRAGSIHLSSIVGNPRIILKYVVDDRSDRFAELKKYWKFDDSVILLTSKDSAKVYNDKSVNAVFIGSPTWTHEDIVVNSLKNNKHVYCEKPIAENIEDTKTCYDTAKIKGQTLFAAFNRRFDPAYRGLFDRVRNGDVGHVQIMKLTARDSPLPSIPYLKTSVSITSAGSGSSGTSQSPIDHFKAGARLDSAVPLPPATGSRHSSDGRVDSGLTRGYTYSGDTSLETLHPISRSTRRAESKKKHIEEEYDDELPLPPE